MTKLLIPLSIALLITPLLASAETCPNLYRTLSFGSRGSDVIELQTFLITQGDLAAGNSTGYFGRMTEAAVQKFQVKHSLVSSGTAATTGFGAVGPRTRAKIAGVCGQQGEISTPTPVDFGDYANFSADRTSGHVPLSVYFQSNLPYERSQYLIDYGDGTTENLVDGTAICHSMVGGACFIGKHSYTVPGTYTARLIKSSGSPHELGSILITATLDPISGTINLGTYSGPRPTITGTANGANKVGILISDKYVHLYGSGVTIPVINGKWSHTIPEALQPGTYNIGLIAQNPGKTVAQGKFNVQSGSNAVSGTVDFATYKENQSTVITGSAVGASTVGISIRNQFGDTVYESAAPISVVNGRWSHTVAVKLALGTHIVSLYGPGGDILSTTGTIDVRY